jgi:tetratricopeptide (TPR) repeat protein
MGNGALVRTLYRDPSIESYFYTQFSESTAADRPCEFLTWDGRALNPLYGNALDLYFQVGSDLLIYDRLAGARHAFRRALETGEDRLDPLYWLGWTELWLLRRPAAEAAWTAFGAKDDSASWFWQMRVARQALNDQRDTLGARRALLAAIKSGIGRPEAHAVLGELLLASRPKYGLLELQVAAFLKPDDWFARRDLVVGLTAQRLDDRARAELGSLARIAPDWRRDTVLVAAVRTLERRAAPARDVVRF